MNKLYFTSARVVDYTQVVVFYYKDYSCIRREREGRELKAPSIGTNGRWGGGGGGLLLIHIYKCH